MSAPLITDEDRRRIAERYPSRSRGRWPFIAVPLLTVLVVWTVWAGLHHADTGVSGELYGYEVQGSNAVAVTLDVYRPDPARPATCRVVAKAESGQIVGDATVPVPAATTKQQQVKLTVRTVEKPVTAVLQGCRLS